MLLSSLLSYSYYNSLRIKIKRVQADVAAKAVFQAGSNSSVIFIGLFMQIVTAKQRKAIDVGEHSVLRFIAFMNGNTDTQGKATV